MNRYEIIEKMFEKLGIKIDGEEIWNIILNDVNINGKSDGWYDVELGKFGDDRKLFFADVVVKNNYDEEDDVYTTDIELLAIKTSGDVVYVEDIKTNED